MWHDPIVPTDLARLHAVFDLAMRIGEGMLTSGAAASEVTATMLRVVSASGYRNVSVSVTLNEVSISYLADPQSAPFTRIRAAGAQLQDYSRLEAYEHATEDYVRGVNDLEAAGVRVAAIASAPGAYPRWLMTAGLAVMGGSAALGLGAGILVTAAATATAVLLALLTDVLSARRVPAFYIQVAGGFVAALAAVAVHLVEPAANSSIVVVACLIILLAGLTSLGAMQDAITGWYVTASARILETLMLTIGLVIGVRGGLLVADLLDADIAVSAAMPVSLTGVVTLLVSGLVLGLGFAISVQTPPRVLAWCSGIAAGSTVVGSVLTGIGVDRVWSVGIVAVASGALAVALAVRLHAPALTFTMAGLIPLLPGSRIYRGLLAIGTDLTAGAGWLFEAAEVAVALAAGAVLGQMLATGMLRASGRAVSAFAPVIAGPFSTLRRRRLGARTRRGAPRGGSTMALERTEASSAAPHEESP